MTTFQDDDDEKIVAYAGEEDLRFIRNFHDVFLSIGLIMLLAGLYIVSEILVGTPDGSGSGTPMESLSSYFLMRALIYGGLAVVSWLLAEFFSRSRRLFLPSMVLFVAWSWFVFVGASMGYLGFATDIQDFVGVMDALKSLRGFPLFLSIIMTAATALFYFRMKLPFAMGALGVSLASFLFSIFIFRQDWSSSEGFAQFGSTFLWLWMGAGALLFFLGMFFDGLDPERRTRLSDNGFWLHLFAAPILFTSATMKFNGSSAESYSPGLMLVIVAVFAFISLLINRRALLVAGLLTAAYAIARIVQEAGLEGMWIAGSTLVMLGGSMVLLGGAWHSIRRVIVAPFPKTGPIARIIPPVSLLE